MKKNKETDFVPVDEVKTEEDVKKEEKKIARRDAKTRVRTYMDTLEDGSAIKDDLLFLIGKKTIGRTSGAFANQKILDYIKETGEMGASEMDLFKEFKVGRNDMKLRIRAFIKTEKPEDRVWIKLFENEEIYKVVATGSKTPPDWTGYIPVREEHL